MSDDNNNNPMKTAANYVFQEPTASTVKTFSSVEDFTHSFNQLLDLLGREMHSLKEAVRLSQVLIDNAVTHESATDEEREALNIFHQGYVDLLNMVRHRCHWTLVETRDNHDDYADNTCNSKDLK